MMHNSLAIREILRKANAEPLARRRRDPHRGLQPIESAAESADSGNRTRRSGPAHVAGLALEGAWRIVASDPRAGALREDIEDFLQRIGVGVARQGTAGEVAGGGGDGGGQVLEIVLDPAVGKGAYEIEAHPGRVTLKGGDMSALWSAHVELEHELRHTGRLSPGKRARRARWNVQISQAPWLCNYLVPDLDPEFTSDDAFRLLAHYGVSGMTIYGDWLCYVTSDVFPELSQPRAEANLAVLKAATERAARYGISLYYVPVSPKFRADHPVFKAHPSARGARLSWPSPYPLHNLCSSDEGVLQLLEETFERLFRAVPLLGGLILLTGGESFYHCFMRPDVEGVPEGTYTNCPRCAQGEPGRIVDRMVDRVAKAVHRVKPDALITSWTYQPIKGDDPDSAKFISAYSGEYAHQVAVGKEQRYQKDGYTKHTWDYTLDFPGVSDLAKRQAELAKARGVPVVIKTETALGLEFIHVPFVPSLPRWAQKWRSVASLGPIAVLQSWMFFGMWGSHAEELGWWVNWRSDLSSGEALRAMAERDFGREAGRVLEAWEACAEAVGHIPQIPMYFTGPQFLGPAHPLVRGELEPADRELFSGGLYYLQELLETFSTESAVKDDLLILTDLPAEPGLGFAASDPGKAWRVFVDEWIAVRDGLAKAHRALAGLDAGFLAPWQAERLFELKTVTEYLYRTARTTVNVYQYLLRAGEKKSPAQADEASRPPAIRDILADELENAKAARRIYQEAPWLDLSKRTDGLFPSSAAMLERKIELLVEAMEAATR